MQRFVLQKNIEKFDALLRSSAAGDRDWMIAALASARQELAMLEASLEGVESMPGNLRASSQGQVHAQFEQALRNSVEPLLLIDAGPGLNLADMTEAYATMIGRPREVMLGRPLFDVFPEDPQQTFG